MSQFKLDIGNGVKLISDEEVDVAGVETTITVSVSSAKGKTSALLFAQKLQPVLDQMISGEEQEEEDEVS